MPELAQLLPILVFALVLWLMLIRPAQKRRNQVLAMQSALKVGDRIELTSGIHGDIIELTDDEARLEIAPGTVITVARGAVGRVVRPADSAAADVIADFNETQD